ncbi:hypothetical protein N9L68_05100 [bacterium]|nr:hypothetical protein [bacterium]
MPPGAFAMRPAREDDFLRPSHLDSDMPLRGASPWRSGARIRERIPPSGSYRLRDTIGCVDKDAGWHEETWGGNREPALSPGAECEPVFCSNNRWRLPECRRSET